VEKEKKYNKKKKNRKRNLKKEDKLMGKVAKRKEGE
jgi:hypothetical protein